MNSLLKQYELTWESTHLILLPCKLAWCPSKKTLFMADSHFGKANTFRRAGYAVPDGTTSKMLNMLSLQIETLGIQKLFVLGDLLHSKVTAPLGFENQLYSWRLLHRGMDVVLIKGNHDKREESFYSRMKIECHEFLEWNGIGLCHDPAHAPTQSFALCGHIHPSIQLGSARLKCFWLRKQLIVLPAFGEFTGTARINLNHGESAVAICEDHLITVPTKAIQ